MKLERDALLTVDTDNVEEITCSWEVFYLKTQETKILEENVKLDVCKMTTYTISNASETATYTCTVTDGKMRRKSIIM